MTFFEGKGEKGQGKGTTPQRRHSPLRFSLFAPAPAHGVTLMEGLTVIGVMAVILVMVSEIFTVSYDVFIKQSARAENETGAVLAARAIAEAARGADAIEPSYVINGTTYTTSANVLVLKLPTLDASNNLVPASHDYMAIYRHSAQTTKIFMDIDAAAGSKRIDGEKLLTANNTIMQFRYNDPDVASANRVQVYLVNSQTKRQTVLTTKAWTAIFMRNN